jgi:spore coat protein U-like protein
MNGTTKLQRIAIVGLAAGIAAAASFATPKMAPAGTATGNMPVSATVSANCAFTTATLNFGAYDPISTNGSSGSDLKLTDNTTALQISCTKGSSATITLNNGSNSGGSCSGTGPACMKDGAGDLLNYGLYTDNTFGTLWTGATSVGYTAASTATTAIKVNGEVYKGQNVGVGTYSDTIQATATF